MTRYREHVVYLQALMRGIFAVVKNASEFFRHLKTWRGIRSSWIDHSRVGWLCGD